MFPNGFQFELTRPELLWALLALPLLWAVFRRSLVDTPRRQLIASLIVRSLIVCLLILAICGPNRLNPSQDVFVVFAVDESLSIGDSGREKAAAFVEEATADRRQNEFAIVPFATSPREFIKSTNELGLSVSATSSNDASPPDEQSTSDADMKSNTERQKWREGTNLQQVTEIAAAAIPPDRVPHIVLLSDGQQTQGDILATAATANLRISTVPLPTRDEPELQVSDIILPAQVAEGEPFRIEVIVDANHADRATVDIFNGEYRVLSEVKEIAEGENRFTFTQQIEKPAEFSAQIRRSDDASADEFNDHLADNNLASGLVYTSGKPRVLLIESATELGRHLEWAMAEEGIVVDTRPAQGMPESLAELQNYSVLILSNVPATDLSSRQMDVIRAWVSELGGGFVMLGGDSSFGLGGYYKTVIEEVLPVRSDFEKEKEKPGLAMVLVLDKSGSMGGQKIELAKDAAKAAVELLGNKDQIGVVAFDGSPYWVSEIRSASQKAVVADRISAIEPGGGTAMYPAMNEAFTALRGTTAKLKHVIVMTDGYSTPGDFEGISQDMAASRITISTVGVGDVDQALLERIAQTGRGRYYFTNNPASIPQIFAKETMTASKSAINEEPFLPLVVRATPVLEGVDFETSPFLLGYVVTRPKPTSEVILATETGDPLLCWWRYGLGMSVAFTSDAKSRWAAEWLTWPGFNTFWAQVIRKIMRKSQSDGFMVDVQRKNGVATVSIDAVDPLGEFLNDATTEVTVVDPQLKTQTISATQTAPGKYECRFPLKDSGSWNLQLTQRIGAEVVNQQARGIVVGYNDELRLRPTNEALLQKIADRTDGNFDIEPSTVFKPAEGQTAASPTALWPWLLSLAAVLFVLDVALRRLDLPRLFGEERSTDHRVAELT